MIRFKCPKCTKALAVAEKLASKKVVCPGCRAKVRVPSASAPQPDVSAVAGEPSIRATTSAGPSPARPSPPDDAVDNREVAEAPDAVRPPEPDDNDDELDVTSGRKRKSRRKRHSSSPRVSAWIAGLIGAGVMGVVLALVLLVRQLSTGRHETGTPGNSNGKTTQSRANWGESFEVEGGVLYYTRGATESDVRKLESFLRKTGFFNNRSEKAILQLSKHGDDYVLALIVGEDEWNNPVIAEGCRNLAIRISQDVFVGSPVEISLCDESLRPKNVIRP
jgi:hypothetical protein